MPALLHTGHEPLIAELLFMLAGLLIVVAVTGYGIAASRSRHRRGMRRKRRRLLDEDVD